MGFLSTIPHRHIERRYKSNLGKKILELGAGNAEHLKFVKPDFSRYEMLDIRVKDEVLLRFKNEKRICFQIGDATNLIYENESFDRVIATCLIAHLNDPENVLKEWLRVVKCGGTLDIYIPCEPGLTLRSFRKLVSEPAAKKLGMQDYSLYNIRDHRQSFHRIETFIKKVFENEKIEIQYRPFLFHSWYFNLYGLARIKKLS